MVGGVPLDPGIIRTSWGGLGKVLGRMYREVAWRGQALGSFSLLPEQGHLCFVLRFQLKDRGSFVSLKERLEGAERLTSFRT